MGIAPGAVEASGAVAFWSEDGIMDAMKKTAEEMNGMTDEARLNVLKRYAEGYAEIWKGIEQGLAQKEDAVFLMGPANYIFLTGGVKWAVDPAFTVPRDRSSFACINADAVMNSLDFILLTHRHADHFDPELMKRYPHLLWIVPGHMEEEVRAHGQFNLQIVRPGDVIRRGEIVIHAFNSLHYDAGTTVGVEETGYFVEANGRRLMLPGDVREYNAEKYPRFEGITHFFAHVWLGRRNALNWPCGSYPGEMAEFILAFEPEKIYLAHLLEATRPLCDMWTHAHAGLVMDEIIARRPGAEVSVPPVGKRILL